MKIIIILMLMVTLSTPSTLQPLSYVDKKKFAGLWYEMARTYNRYQERCTASSVEYMLNKRGEYDVYNRCFDTTIGGDLIEYKGVAKEVDERQGVAKMEMTYFWIFSKRYAIYYIDSNYQEAIVADEAFEQAWIMSRTPQMEPKRLHALMARVGEQVAKNRWIITLQDPKGRYR
jgi:apolipoprotein D and lipocalin family protein